MKKFAIILFLIVFALFACTQKTQDKKDPYLAKVGKATITQSDYDKEFESLPDYAQRLFQDDDGEKRFLEEIIKKELLYQEAIKRGMDKTAEFKRQYDEFKKLTLISELFEKEIISKAEVTEEDVKAFYEENQEGFTTTSKIKVSHILVTSEAKANKILERLRKGEDFKELAKAASVDKTSAQNGGDLGYRAQGEMVPEFEKVALSLEIGELSDPVKTPLGYHIIKVTDKKQGPTVEFENVKNMIYQKLYGEKQQEVFDQFIAELKKKFKVTINERTIAKQSKDKKETETPSITPEKPEGLKEERPAESEAENIVVETEEQKTEQSEDTKVEQQEELMIEESVEKGDEKSAEIETEQKTGTSTESKKEKH